MKQLRDKNAFKVQTPDFTHGKGYNYEYNPVLDIINSEKNLNYIVDRVITLVWLRDNIQLPPQNMVEIPGITTKFFYEMIENSASMNRGVKVQNLQIEMMGKWALVNKKGQHVKYVSGVSGVKELIPEDMVKEVNERTILFLYKHAKSKILEKIRYDKYNNMTFLERMARNTNLAKTQINKVEIEKRTGIPFGPRMNQTKLFPWSNDFKK